MISREQRTPLSEWWWTVDRLLLAAILTLMLAGVILSLAASPPVAARIGLDPFHFFNRHVVFLIPSFIVLIAVSFLSPRQVRRSALIVFVISIGLIVATLLFGPEVKGAKRWITLVGVNIQASEIAKPSFVILVAWLFAKSARRPEMPATSMALALLLMLVTLLVAEPDFGQTMLISMVWGTLFFIAGMRMIWVFGLMGVSAAGLFTAYLFRAARRGSHQALHGPGVGRYVPGRHGVGIVLPRRLVRPGTRRGHGEAYSPRQSYRLRVRGRRRGVRDHPVPGVACAVCFHRHPLVVARLRQRGSVRALCGCGSRDHVWHSGLDQHGGETFI